jgi:hypothetical protein
LQALFGLFPRTANKLSIRQAPPTGCMRYEHEDGKNPSFSTSLANCISFLILWLTPDFVMPSWLQCQTVWLGVVKPYFRHLCKPGRQVFKPIFL